MRTKRRYLFCVAPLLACAALFAPRGAEATVDALLETNIVYRHPQVEKYCYLQVPVSAELGIPAVALIQGSLAPSFAPRFASPRPPEWELPNIVTVGGQEYESINALAHGAALAFTYAQDSFANSGTLELRGELDVSAVAAENGTSVAGRQATIDKAKLALLVIAKDLKDSNAYAGGKYRLYLSFKGLPSQEGLQGSRVYEKTSAPYSGGSPVLLGYEKELIDARVCGAQSALYSGKSDEEPDGIAAQPADAAGCRLGPAGAVSSAFSLLALLGLALLARRNRRRD
jgi:hypothetical protein